jgi:hypothetical protein
MHEDYYGLNMQEKLGESHKEALAQIGPTFEYSAVTSILMFSFTAFTCYRAGLIQLFPLTPPVSHRPIVPPANNHIVVTILSSPECSLSISSTWKWRSSYPSSK